MGVWPSADLDLCEFPILCLQVGKHLLCQPSCHSLPNFLFPFQYFFFGSINVVFFCDDQLIFLCAIGGRSCQFFCPGLCIFLDSGADLFHNFAVTSQDNFNCWFIFFCNMTLNLPLSESKFWLMFCLTVSLFSSVPQNLYKTEEIDEKSQNIIRA